jgi:hypothetical protein
MVADIALCVLAVEQLVFTLQYVSQSPWWRTEIGRIYAMKSVIWTLVVLQVSLSVITSSDYPGRHWYRLSIYIGGAVSLALLIVLLVRIQRQGRAARRAAGDVRTQRQLWADTLREWAGKASSR